MAELTVISWRDIPLQVTVRSGRTTARALLSDRFQEAVDAAAMVAGPIGSEDYTAQMATGKRPCGEDLQAEADGEAARLEAAWSEDDLRAAIRAGGYRAEEPAS